MKKGKASFNRSSLPLFHINEKIGKQFHVRIISPAGVSIPIKPINALIKIKAHKKKCPPEDARISAFYFIHFFSDIIALVKVLF